MSGFWTQRNPREKFLIVICVAAVAIGVPMLLIPQETSGKKLLSASEARHKFEGAVRLKDKLQDDSSRLKPEIETLAYNEAPEELVPKVIRELQGYAKASGVHLREIKPMRPRRIQTLTKVPLTVRFSTLDFGKSVISFLYRAEDPKGRLVVEKLNVTAADQKTHTVDVEAQVALFTLRSGETTTRGKEREG